MLQSLGRVYHVQVPENYLTELKLAKGTRRLKPEQVAILKYWMADAKNWPHPYPDESVSIS